MVPSWGSSTDRKYPSWRSSRRIGRTRPSEVWRASRSAAGVAGPERVLRACAKTSAIPVRRSAARRRAGRGTAAVSAARIAVVMGGRGVGAVVRPSTEPLLPDEGAEVDWKSHARQQLEDQRIDSAGVRGEHCRNCNRRAQFLRSSLSARSSERAAVRVGLKLRTCAFLRGFRGIGRR